MAVSSKNPLMILGGGLMGLAIAYELALKGKKVVVLSRRRSEAAGFVAAGMLAPYAEGLNQSLLQLGQLSLDRVAKWIQNIETLSGIKCGLQNCGTVVPFRNNESLESFPTAVFGEELNRVQLEREVPGIASIWKTGLLFTQDGQIDNRRQLMRALEKACTDLEVHFQEGVEVLGLLKEGKQLIGVQVQDAEGQIKNIKSEEAVLCCGAWSNQVVPEIPVFPVKGQMLSLQGPKNAMKRVLFGEGTYLVPREDGLLIVGATNEQDAGFREGLTPSGQKKLHEGIRSLLPRANEWPQMERWWGFRPCTPDQSPILGSSNLQGLWLATGHHRNGVLLAAITAELITKCICDTPLTNEESEALKQFQWKRFAKNPTFY